MKGRIIGKVLMIKMLRMPRLHPKIHNSQALINLRKREDRKHIENEQGIDCTVINIHLNYFIILYCLWIKIPLIRRYAKRKMIKSAQYSRIKSISMMHCIKTINNLTFLHIFKILLIDYAPRQKPKKVPFPIGLPYKHI